jgi:hypothetical protein
LQPGPYGRSGARTLKTVSRVLRPGGWLVSSITHPIIRTPDAKFAEDAANDPSWEVSGYFEEGFWRSEALRGIRGRVGSYHRTMSAYVNALVDAGLSIECFVEPQATGRLAGRFPIFREVPAVLAARCGKVVK